MQRTLRGRVAPASVKRVAGPAVLDLGGMMVGGGEGRGQGLQVAGLACLRGGGERLVLRDVSFDVAPGGAVLLLGPNGAGKTTLLRVVAGLVRPDAGSVLWDGLPVGRVGWLGHQDAVKPGLTARENLAFAARAGGSGGDTDAALDAMALLPLADLPARLLSAGQKRRLAIARLTLAGSPLWLLDEPTLGLDAASVESFGALLARHRATGGVVIAATHLPLPLPDAVEVRL